MSRESRLRRTPSCAARPIAYVAPARSMTTTNRAATATGYGQPLQKSTGASVGGTVDCECWIPTLRGIPALYTACTPCTGRTSHAAWDTDAGHCCRQPSATGARSAQNWRVLANPLRQAGPRLTNTLQAPSRNPSTGMDRAGNPPSSGLAPKDRLTYLEHCGNCATTNSTRTIGFALNRPSSQILPIWHNTFPMWQGKDESVR
jgi:hypothetical protein